MNFISKGNEKVSVASLDDAKILITALSDYGCQETFNRQEVIGKSEEGQYGVAFDDKVVTVMTLTDVLTVSGWLLSLKCKRVEVMRLDD